MTRVKSWLLFCLTVCLIAAAAVVYYFVDPADSPWLPRCLWKTLTATDCPGCGSQRMAHAILHGDFIAAWKANAYAMCMLPVIIFLLWLEWFRDKYPRLYARVHAPWLIWTFFATVVLWWIIRNFFHFS